MKVSTPLFLLFFAALSCNSDHTQEQALIELFKKEKELNCQLTSIKDQITSKWDRVALLLSESLPKDLPAEEKRNMLKVRNANLIRMFQSYDNLSEGVKTSIDSTEQLDISLTEQILVLKKEIQQVETGKAQIFQSIRETSGKEEVERLRNLNQSLLSESCP